MKTPNPSYQKLQKRFGQVFQFGAVPLLNPMLGVLSSFLVVQFGAIELWGRFVTLLILLQLVQQVAAWGNTEFLLRAFSKDPRQFQQLWQRALFSRIGLLVPLLGCFFLLPLKPIEMLGLVVFGSMGFWCQSFESVLVFQKRFKLRLVVELGGQLLLAFCLWGFRHQLDLKLILFLYALVSLIKGGVLFVSMGKTILRPPWAGFDSTLLKASFPFFLLGFSGMVFSKSDLYTVRILLGDRETGVYQILIHFLLLVQSLSHLMLKPFVRNLYRLGPKSSFKLARRMFVLGLVVIPPCVLALRFIMIWVYSLHLSWDFFVWGFMFSLPTFYFMPLIYLLYKQGREGRVLKINCFGFALNIALNFVLIHWMGLVGAICASAICQWLLLLVYGLATPGSGD